jgi:hypothetical protein
MQVIKGNEMRQKLSESHMEGNKVGVLFKIVS